MSTILVLHGPNLNMLGTREPEVYGHETLADIDDRLRSKAAEKGHHLLHLQSNAEYELIERVHEARAEVHLSNVHAREPFRHHSYFSDIAEGVICGLGSQGYDLALKAALQRIHR